MFGKNALAGPTPGDDGSKLRVVDIFPTIQGEGPYAGTPAWFIRLAGCNLRCFFCDTDFETGAQWMSIAGILGVMEREKHLPLVVITGGEPLLQEVGPLCEALLDAAYAVQIETAGTRWPSLGLPERVTIVCSPKTGTVHPRVRMMCGHWKYIVCATDPRSSDGRFLACTQDPNGKPVALARGIGTTWVQPRFDYLDKDTPHVAANVRNTEYAIRLCMQEGYRLSVQIHKVVGLP